MSSIGSGSGGSSVGDIFSKLFPQGGGGGLTADPLFRLGMGLLSRSGPAAQPHTFGQDLAGAFSDLDKAQRQDITDETARLGLDDYKSDLGRKKNSLQKAEEFFQQMQDSLKGMDSYVGAQVTPTPLTPPGLGPQQMPVNPTAIGQQGLAPGTQIAPQAPGSASVFTSQPSPQGLSPDYFDKIGAFESGMTGPEAYNVQGRIARGKYQFTNPTYQDYAPNPSDWSPEMQERAIRKFTSANEGSLKLNQLPVGDETAYITHLLGNAGGPKALRAGDNALVSDVVDPAAIAQNPKVFTGVKTVGDLKNKVASIVFGRGAGSAPAPALAPAAGTPDVAGGGAPLGGPATGGAPGMEALGPDAPQLFNAMQSIPKATLQKIYPLAYAAAGGDPLIAMQLTGQAALKIIEERDKRAFELAKARADDNEISRLENFDDPVDGHRITRVVTKGGKLRDLTEAEQQIIGDSTKAGTGAGVTPSGDPDDPKVQKEIEKIAKYEQDLPTANSRQGQKYRLDRIAQASAWREEHGLAPFNEHKYKSISVAMNRFTSGVNGDIIRSLDVAAGHIQQMDELIGALENGNIPLFNRIAQAWAKETGQTAPTNFDAAKEVVGDEIIKALVRAGGTLYDREQIKKTLDKANSPSQLKGVIKTLSSLLGGQLGGLKRQYDVSVGDGEFDLHIDPKNAELLKVTLGREAQTGVPDISPFVKAKEGYSKPAKSKSGILIHKNLSTGNWEEYE